MTTGSLIGLMGCIALLVCSYMGGHDVCEGGGLVVSLQRGFLCAAAIREQDAKAPGRTITRFGYADVSRSSRIAELRLALDCYIMHSSQLSSSYRVLPCYRNGVLHCSLWLPCLVFGILPARSCLLWRRRHLRKKKGLCLDCGYDLRASCERCPECGTEFDVDRLILKADR